MHLRQPRFTYSACGPFTKKTKIKETGDSRYVYQNELDKDCFQHDMDYGDFKDLTRITVSVKHCVIKHLVLLKIQSMMDTKGVLLQ